VCTCGPVGIELAVTFIERGQRAPANWHKEKNSVRSMVQDVAIQREQTVHQVRRFPSASGQQAPSFNLSLAAASKGITAATLPESGSTSREDPRPAGAATSGRPAARADASGSGATKVVTPFGTFDWSPPAPQTGTDTPPPSIERDFFLTHQPAEWRNNPEIRAAFAKLYGDKALVTLDWTGTVPENILDTVWVTHVPVDSTGRPFPKSGAQT
jgi:hypothetical protein